MASPLWAYPGVLEGRVAPVFGTPGPTLPVYSSPPGFDYYGYGHGHVFCLGKDSIPFASQRLSIGAVVSVEQTFVVLDIHKFLLFIWQMRVPDDVPELRTVVTAAPVSFVQGAASAGCRGLLNVADGASGLILDAPGLAAQFVAGDKEQWIRISGASDAANNGVHRTTGVFPAAAGGYLDRVVVENQNRLGLGPPDTATMLEHLHDPAVTIEVLGLRWVGRAYCDWGGGWAERVVLQESASRNVLRTSMALHVSQYVGVLKVKFEMTLEQVS